MTQDVRIAVLGCGGWGKNIVRSVQRLGALHCVADPTERGRALAREFAPQTQIVASADEVFASDDIDAVMIATPAETHFELACRALDADKDVFVEKPMTINVDEAAMLVARADESGRILMVGHLLEYHPAVRKLAAMIQNDELGRVHYIISNRLNLGKIRTEENALWSFAPHDIAVILRLVGAMPYEVVATGGNYITPNIADVTVTQMLFNNGIRSHIFVSWLHPFKEQKLVVVGSKKMASFDDVSKELVLYDQRVGWEEGQPIPVRGEGTMVEYPADEPLLLECRHFMECVQRREQPLTDGRNGLAVLQVLHAAQRSLMTNGYPTQISAAAVVPTSGRPQEAAPKRAAMTVETVSSKAQTSHARI